MKKKIIISFILICILSFQMLIPYSLADLNMSSDNNPEIPIELVKEQTTKLKTGIYLDNWNIDDYTITWETSDESVIEITDTYQDNNGWINTKDREVYAKVKAVGDGSAIVTCTVTVDHSGCLLSFGIDGQWDEIDTFTWPITVISELKSGDLTDVLTDYSAYEPEDKQSDANKMTEMAGKFLSFIQIVGSVTSVIVLAIIGIKYMLASTEEKAEYKQTLLPYVIGAILVFSTTNIAKLLYDLGYSLK